jgi:hypothetical protein
MEDLMIQHNSDKKAQKSKYSECTRKHESVEDLNTESKECTQKTYRIKGMYQKNM